jgi:hypothetical protein
MLMGYLYPRRNTDVITCRTKVQRNSNVVTNKKQIQ